MNRKTVWKNVLGCVAFGDALGNRLEFNPNPTTQDFDREKAKRVLTVSDDTQMSLFLAESMLDPHSQGTAEDSITKGYINWYLTQTTSPDKSATGLLSFPELYDVQAPGNTCMGSMRTIIQGKPVTNDSKGNGTVMRCSPIALYASFAPDLHTIIDSRNLAAIDARITHKHPAAAQSSMELVEILIRLMHGEDLDQILIDHKDNLPIASRWEQNYANLYAFSCGWVADEALQLAVGAVMLNKGKPDPFWDAIKEAVCIQGDSDSVGAIAGSILGAAGILPENFDDWLARLNVKRPLDYILSLV